jgi:hypothetical protein
MHKMQDLTDMRRDLFINIISHRTSFRGVVGRLKEGLEQSHDLGLRICG